MLHSMVAVWYVMNGQLISTLTALLLFRLGSFFLRQSIYIAHNFAMHFSANAEHYTVGRFLQ